jgi:hypothetical protein
VAGGLRLACWARTASRPPRRLSTPIVRAMPGEFFFMAMGGLGLSLAGFAGLIAALTPEQQRNSPIARWRISRVVIYSLHLTFLGFGVIAIFALLEDSTQTVRVASGLAALIFSIGKWRSLQPGPAWPDERVRRSVIALSVVVVAVFLVNAVLGTVWYLHMIMLLFLLEPALIFVAAIHDATSDPTTSRPD